MLEEPRRAPSRCSPTCQAPIHSLILRSCRMTFLAVPGSDSLYAMKLWRTDGTAAGGNPLLSRTLAPGFGKVSHAALFAHLKTRGSKISISAYTPRFGPELWTVKSPIAQCNIDRLCSRRQSRVLIPEWAVLLRPIQTRHLTLSRNSMVTASWRTGAK